jgi:hypothetical protein
VTTLENALFQWQEGQRRLNEAEPADRRAMERAIERIVEELRRRLGGPFTTAELAELYEQGTDWALDVAISAAPDNPRAWDSGVADAAFARYVRGAKDYAGGRPTAAE